MNWQLLHEVLGWAALINYLLLLLWFVMFVYAGDWIYRLHSRWFELSRQQFSVIHYSGMAAYKLAIFIFYLMPYLALHIVA